MSEVEQFQQRCAELNGELYVLQKGQESADRADHRRLLEVQYELGKLCVANGENQLAVVYFEQLVATIQSRAVGDDELPDQELVTALHANVLNHLATLQFRLGNCDTAMSLLLEAKQVNRKGKDCENSSPVEDAFEALDKPLAVNYAVFLHAQGNVHSAVQIAHRVVGSTLSGGSIDDSREQCTIGDAAARSTAFMLLATCSHGQDEHSAQTIEYAEKAVAAAEQTENTGLQCRAHSNLGLYYFERGDTIAALPHFVAACRAARQCGEQRLQSITKYHMSIALAHADAHDSDTLEVVSSLNHPSSTDSLVSDIRAADATAVNSQNQVGSDGNTTPARELTPKDWLLQSESIATALPVPDKPLGVALSACRGEDAFYTGDLTSAEAEFTTARKRLRQLLGRDDANDDDEVDLIAARGIDDELTKLQGFLLSYSGHTQFVEGKFELAERSHQRDLSLALQLEDVYAQQRALRNLATLFNCTQRYREAIPLWHDVLEIAVVLQSKSDQITALSGLGIALKEHQLTSPPSDEEDGTEEEASIRAPPLPVFLRQRALAVEIGDRYQQILAQRSIVGLYESGIAETTENAIEKWLAECDTLVRLCDQHYDLQLLADAYRSLANALTAQVTRLRARGSTRFADAITVLSQKRDAFCAKYQDTISAQAVSATQGSGECLSRPSVVRVDALTRR